MYLFNVIPLLYNIEVSPAVIKISKPEVIFYCVYVIKISKPEVIFYCVYVTLALFAL